MVTCCSAWIAKGAPPAPVPPRKKPGKVRFRVRGRAVLATGVCGRGVQDAVDAAGLEEELRAILQVVIQRHLGDHGVDPDLQRQDIDLAQHRLHRAEFPFGAIDQDGVVLVVRVSPAARPRSDRSRLAPARPAADWPRAGWLAAVVAGCASGAAARAAGCLAQPPAAA